MQSDEILWRKLNKEKPSPPRLELANLSLGGLTLDLSLARISAESHEHLFSITESYGLRDHIARLFDGEIVNPTEQRPALHTALREPNPRPEVARTLTQIENISHHIRNNTQIKSIINIGIGGSDLGPKLICTALKNTQHPRLTCHFVANLDPDDLNDCLAQCEPESTVFIISSKSFTTLETLTNARRAMDWLGDRSEQVYAVTAESKKAREFGINNILPIWDWVGGRYSVWSAIGLPIAILQGFECFQDFLAGANLVDAHYLTTPWDQNLPALMGIRTVYYSTICHYATHAILPYAQRLKYLPQYLQQLEMESCGKSRTLKDEFIHYRTGSIIWGEVGSIGQHSFHQFLHEGTHTIPSDFIIINYKNPTPEQQLQHANAKGQIAALTQNHQPTTKITLDALSPINLGSLLALYEHKVYTQSILWQINPFDQPGVELAKKFAQAFASDARNTS